MTLKVYSIIKSLLDLLNNNWIVGISLLVFGSYLSNQIMHIRLMIDKLLYFSDILYKPLVYLTLLIFSSSIIFRLFRLYKRWKLIYFRDQHFLLSFDPILKIMSFLKRKRVNTPALASILEKFKHDTNSNYYSIVESSELKGLECFAKHTKGVPTIVLKLPARTHIALPDFQDLRLLRNIVAAGGRVVVIIIDVPYLDKQPENINMEQCYNKTYKIIRQVLGSNVIIQRLSTMFSKNIDDFLRFLFDTYIPLYANKLDKKIYTHKIETDSKKILNISYLVFALLLKALTYLYKKDQSLMIIQWKERLFKWTEFSEFMKRNLGNIRITGFILGETFFSYSGKKLRTSVDTFEDLSFTLTESNSSVAKKLLSFEYSNEQIDWKIPNNYILYLARNVFGYKITNELKDQNILHENRKKLEAFYVTHTGRECLSLKDESALKSLYIRYKFHKEFSRVQKKLFD